VRLQNTDFGGFGCTYGVVDLTPFPNSICCNETTLFASLMADQSAQVNIATYNIQGSGENLYKLFDRNDLDLVIINEAYKVDIVYRFYII
jgi:hypothetical protein